MKRALLFGRDPIYAWTLRKVLEPMGFLLEHVYTLSEAKLRMERFEYQACFLDGLRPEEMEEFLHHCPAGSDVIVVDVNSQTVETEGYYYLPKDYPVNSMVSFVRSFLQK